MAIISEANRKLCTLPYGRTRFNERVMPRPRVVSVSKNSLKISTTRTIISDKVEINDDESRKSDDSSYGISTDSPKVNFLVNHPRVTAKELELEFKVRRSEIVQPNGFISTPLHVMKILAEKYQADIHTEVYKICHSNTEIQDMWRVEVFVEQTSGIGQSPRRALSLQLAAADLLQKLHKNHPNYPIRPYGLIPGCLIKPKIHKDLIELCRKNGHSKPMFEPMITHDLLSKFPKYAVCCKVGQIHITGRSDNRIFASRIAAKKMFITISGEKYDDDFANIGEEQIIMNPIRSTLFNASLEKQKRIDMNLKINKLPNGKSDTNGFETDEDEEQWFDAITSIDTIKI